MIDLLHSLQSHAPLTFFSDLEAEIAARSMMTVQIAAAALFVLTIIAVLANKRTPKLKLPLFILISFTMVGTTLSLIGSTVYLNVKADSGGPVHWHADIETWACGTEIELRDPTGFSNKIGTPTLHEHDDHRIHLEGVVVDRKVDATIGKFMSVIGGSLTETGMIVPVNPSDGPLFEDESDGDSVKTENNQFVEAQLVGEGKDRTVILNNGDMCGNFAGEVQVFVYRVSEDGKTYSQYKLNDKEIQQYFEIDSIGSYSISETPNVPPGDCIIFEFDVPKTSTDKLCKQFGVRDIDRCEQFGVLADQREICTMKQVPNGIAGSEIDTKSICEITYNANGKVVGISAAADYEGDLASFDPKEDCSNYPKDANGELD